MSEEAKIRRDRTALIYGGMGVMAFSLWSIVKIIMQVVLDPMGLRKYMDTAEDSEFVYFMVTVFLLIIVVTDALFRLYLGISAIREGKGVHKSLVYVVLAALCLLVTVAVDVVTIVSAVKDKYIDTDTLTSLFINATSNVIMWQIIAASVRLRLERRRA